MPQRTAMRDATRLTVLLVVMGLTAASASAQVRYGTLSTPRLGQSPGSAWTLGPSFPVGGGGSSTNITINVRGSARSPFFGGVSVGRGFSPYYLPPYVVGYGHIGYSQGFVTRNACGVPVTQYVPLPLSAYVPVTSPWYFGYTPGVNYPVSPIGYYGFSGTGFSGTGFSGIGFGAFGQNDRVPGNSYTPGQSGASFRDTVSRSRLNETPPVDFGKTFTRTVQDESANDIPEFAEFKPWLDASVVDSPIAVEYPAAAEYHKVATPIDQAENQRLRARGDDALRESDFELARTFYQAAFQAMPEAGTASMRMSWAHLFQQEYPRAVANLKRALTAERFDELVWADSSMLLNSADTELFEQTESAVWQWLAQRPGSADRLLLAAGYQHFTGQSRIAADLLKLAQSAGADEQSCERLKSIVIGEHEARQPGSTVASATQAP